MRNHHLYDRSAQYLPEIDDLPLVVRKPTRQECALARQAIERRATEDGWPAAELARVVDMLLADCPAA